MSSSKPVFRQMNIGQVMAAVDDYAKEKKVPSMQYPKEELTVQATPPASVPELKAVVTPEAAVAPVERKPKEGRKGTSPAPMRRFTVEIPDYVSVQMSIGTQL